MGKEKDDFQVARLLRKRTMPWSIIRRDFFRLLILTNKKEEVVEYCYRLFQVIDFPEKEKMTYVELFQQREDVVEF